MLHKTCAKLFTTLRASGCSEPRFRSFTSLDLFVYKVLPPTCMLVYVYNTLVTSHSEWSTIGWSKKQRQTKSYQSTPHFSIFLVDSPSRNWKRTQESWESKHRRYMVSASGLWPMSSKTDARFIMATRVSWLASKNHRKVIFHLFRRGRPKYWWNSISIPCSKNWSEWFIIHFWRAETQKKTSTPVKKRPSLGMFSAQCSFTHLQAAAIQLLCFSELSQCSPG